MKKGYFKVSLTIFIFLIGLMHLPEVNLHSLEGIFSIMWFGVGGIVILANFIHILKNEKDKKVLPSNKRRGKYSL